jgi:hypothetical protein
MKAHTIGAPLWDSGDARHYPNCERETNWLDITEAPRALENLFCYQYR